MPLKRKVRIFIVLLNFFLIGTIYLFFTLLVSNSYKKIEMTQAKNDVLYLSSAFESKLLQLDATTADYAYWDDTYEYLATRNPGYITRNLNLSANTVTGVEMFILTDTNGNKVVGKYFDKNAGFMKDFPDHDFRLISRALYSDISTPITDYGYIDTSLGLIMLSRKPVLRTDKSGVSRGDLIFGKFVDKDLSTTIKTLTKKDFEINTRGFTDSRFARIISRVLIEGVYVDVIDDSTMNAYAYLNDLYGKPAALMKVAHTRDINANTRSIFAYLVGTLFFIGIVNVSLSNYFIDSVITKPVRKFAFDINKIRTSGNFSSRVNVPGQGEISILASVLNRMLESLEVSSMQLKSINKELTQKKEELEKKSNELEQINKFMVNRELKMIELKDQIEELKGKLGTK